MKRSHLTFNEAFDWIQNQTSLVKEVVDGRVKNHHLGQEHMQRYMREEWNLMQNELTRERGLWGSVLPLK